jgi:hypothetical protein
MDSKTLISKIRYYAGDRRGNLYLTELTEILITRIFHLWDLQEVGKRHGSGDDVETDLDRELLELITVAEELKLGSF